MQFSKFWPAKKYPEKSETFWQIASLKWLQISFKCDQIRYIIFFSIWDFEMGLELYSLQQPIFSAVFWATVQKIGL